jgi:hypothetical protein
MIAVPIRRGRSRTWTVVEERVAADPDDPGHVVRAGVLEPDGAGVQRGGGPPAGADAVRGAADFRLFWDNAYPVHTLTDDFVLGRSTCSDLRGGGRSIPHSARTR